MDGCNLHHNDGLPSTRKKFMGEPEMSFVQTKGMGGEFVVKIVFQSDRLIEDWICTANPVTPLTCRAIWPLPADATESWGGGIGPPPSNSRESMFGKPLLEVD